MMVCYFGHTVPEQCDDAMLVPYPYVDAMRLHCVKASHHLHCLHCPELLGICLHDDPPEGTHQGLFVQRMNVFNDEIMYKPVCWCGWNSGWFNTLAFAERELDKHYADPV